MTLGGWGAGEAGGSKQMKIFSGKKQNVANKIFTITELGVGIKVGEEKPGGGYYSAVKSISMHIHVFSLEQFFAQLQHGIFTK